MLTTLVLAFVAISAIQADNDIWSAFPGGQMVQISAKGEHLWAIDSAHNVYKWNGEQWTNISNGYHQVAACADGFAWARPYGSKHPHRLNSTGYSFGPIEGIDVFRINAYSKDLAIAVTFADKVYVWDASDWTLIGHDARAAGIGERAERWMIGNNYSIFRWQEDKWNVIQGPKASTIDVQNEHRVVITSIDDKVYTWQDPKWELVDGLLAESATISETHIFAIPEVHIWTAEAKSCQASWIGTADMYFLGCSVTIESSDGMTAEKCCQKCKKVPQGGGCYFHDNVCNVCNGEVKDEQPMKGSVMFYHPLTEP